ncbi:methyltransferase family protein [Serratia fonticola]|jgi:2-polyprenyl-3-methyl-5-hydroxy-6-metoxy-1,4-benzoquinol methylase|uniref:Methyltransferase family protein n=1 Tax=Serratia fonticola TaxID=47917 RepID=A0A559TBG5_SERFO|nr:class I SAM-dependent methyltransferase [Serratia fonticola]TQI80519.1 methyltransferase family protein [Serratia fonticola]TQI97456.1 methyltransferase family protein [Serratia fonticola]TVZ71953.1 methyltransferase family protein [Serratia fonticola]
MKLNENYGDRIFCHEMADEMHRLTLISNAYDFISQRQISALITQPGTRCLDIGSGTGSIAEWLSMQPNVQEVVALDRFVHLLERRLTVSQRLQIVQHDLNDDDYYGEFDLIHIRFVLMHLRNREDLLKKISKWLKPGGWLVVSDSIHISLQEIDDPLFQKVMSTMWQALINSIGSDEYWSHELQSQFQSLGLKNISVEAYLPSVGKGTPMAEFWCLTWQAMRDRMLETGDLDDKTLKAAEKRLMQEGMIALSSGMMTCIGQK